MVLIQLVTEELKENLVQFYPRVKLMYIFFVYSKQY
jgi:hypothetical protein